MPRGFATAPFDIAGRLPAHGLEGIRVDTRSDHAHTFLPTKRASAERHPHSARRRNPGAGARLAFNNVLEDLLQDMVEKNFELLSQ